MLIIFLAVFVFYLPRIKWRSVVLHKKIFMMFLFCFWIGLTVMAKATPGEGMTRELASYFMFWDILPFVCGLIISAFYWKLDYRWCLPVLLILLILALWSISENWAAMIYGRYRVTGFAEIAHNKFGLVVGCFSIAVINNLYNSNKKRIRKKLYSIVFICVAAPVIIFSGSMGNIISLTLTCAVFFLASKGRSLFSKSLIRRIVILFIAAFLCVLLLRNMAISARQGLSANVMSENIGKYVDRVTKIIEGRIVDLDSGRVRYVRQYYRQFLQDPLFGKGFGSRSGIRHDPHNFIVELAGETGIISVLFYLMLILPALRSSILIFRDKYERGTLFLAALFVIALFFSSFFSGSVFMDSQIWFLIGFLPIISKVPGRDNADLPGLRPNFTKRSVS
jgi:hypothetical protein